ncbi:TetR/AcrR family transcriptional regulator [Gordonia soli]|uniref:Putative TetR family transcriptional regulator n=1 Tax=Gordonia soli NBRC 108243 TaxID=1223545 RepID=M0QR83_9ACTN|nr:TetR/AcrR family transcriptional regulator [Gordonia soli]GAC70914.1 putative TetR family transcriptional regulator [Gordonia soli NBRC 108243]
MAEIARAAAGKQPRRRRTPAEAQEEILTAARLLLATGSIEHLTVATLMQHTTLSRKSFYVYFADRAELLQALVRPIRVEADAALARWSSSDDPVGAGLAALAAAAHMYRRHSPILRAILASSVTSPDLDSVRSAFVQPMTDVATAIVGDTAPDLDDPDAVATALVTMNVHVLLTLHPDSSDAEVDAIVDAIATIWRRTLRLDRD